MFGCKSVEPKVKEALRSQNMILSQLFELSKCELESNSHQDCSDDQNIAHESIEDKVWVNFKKCNVYVEINYIRFSAQILLICLLLYWHIGDSSLKKWIVIWA